MTFVPTEIKGAQCVAIRCPDCERPVASLLPDGSIQIQSRHGGQTHYAVVSLRDIVKHAGKKRVEGILRSL